MTLYLADLMNEDMRATMISNEDLHEWLNPVFNNLSKLLPL